MKNKVSQKTPVGDARSACDCYNSSVAFNHYAKIKRILEQQPAGWIIKRIDQPTQAKNFKGETVYFRYYYRIYSQDGQPVKYGKFQQVDRLAKVLGVPVEALPIIEQAP